MRLLEDHPIETDTLDGEALIGEARRLRRRRWAIGSVAVLAAVLVGVVLFLAGSRPPARPATGLAKAHGTSPGQTDSSGDVIEMRTTFADGSTSVEWSNGSGTVTRVVQRGPRSPESLTTIGASGTTTTTLDRATRTWTSVSGPRTTPVVPESSVLGRDARARQSVFGRWTLKATDVRMDGQITDEFSRPAPNGPIWVNAMSDLPVRTVSPLGFRTDWTYFAPTRAALSELTLTIPRGYKKLSVPSHPFAHRAAHAWDPTAPSSLA